MNPKTPENSKNRQQLTHFDIQPSKPLLVKLQESSANTDKTSYHPDQAHWSINSLPAVLYVLRPGAQHKKSRARVLQTPTEIFGRHIRDFPVLPLQISSQVEGWRLEAWWRLDRRIEAQDIVDRIDPKFKTNNGIGKAELETRREDFRRDFHVADWRSQVSMNDIAKLMRRRGLDPALSNSTRGITPGLINPEKGESAGRIPTPDVSGRPVSPFFVLQGLERPTPSALPTIMPNGNWSAARSLPESRDSRPALNPHQCLSRGLLPSYTPTPPVQSPQPQKRVAPESNRLVTPPPKKQKIVTPRQQITTTRKKTAAYPELQCDLASHQGAPVFREQSKSNSEGIMTLEEYLDRNQMTFEEYLCRDEDEENNKQQGIGKRRATDRNIVNTASSKGNVIDPWLLVL